MRKLSDVRDKIPASVIFGFLFSVILSISS